MCEMSVGVYMACVTCKGSVCDMCNASKIGVYDMFDISVGVYLASKGVYRTIHG